MHICSYGKHTKIIKIYISQHINQITLSCITYCIYCRYDHSLMIETFIRIFTNVSNMYILIQQPHAYRSDKT